MRWNHFQLYSQLNCAHAKSFCQHFRASVSGKVVQRGREVRCSFSVKRTVCVQPILDDARPAWILGMTPYSRSGKGRGRTLCLGPLFEDDPSGQLEALHDLAVDHERAHCNRRSRIKLESSSYYALRAQFDIALHAKAALRCDARGDGRPRCCRCGMSLAIQCLQHFEPRPRNKYLDRSAAPRHMAGAAKRHIRPKIGLGACGGALVHLSGRRRRTPRRPDT